MKLLRDLLLGFVKIHILYHAQIEPIYGTGISDELEEHGYQLSWGTLYPLLHSLEADGLLAREDRIVGGKIRKYYTITPLGREALVEATQKAVELVTEIVDDDPRDVATVDGARSRPTTQSS
jgi:PadR family transcriptional regulator, regulatory protein PadR